MQHAEQISFSADTLRRFSGNSWTLCDEDTDLGLLLTLDDVCYFLPVGGLYLTQRSLASSKGARVHNELEIFAVLEAQTAWPFWTFATLATHNG